MAQFKDSLFEMLHNQVATKVLHDDGIKNMPLSHAQAGETLSSILGDNYTTAISRVVEASERLVLEFIADCETLTDV